LVEYGKSYEIVGQSNTRGWEGYIRDVGGRKIRVKKGVRSGERRKMKGKLFNIKDWMKKGEGLE
jgi:hypothetical protein